MKSLLLKLVLLISILPLNFRSQAQYHLSEDFINKACLAIDFNTNKKLGSGFFIQSNDHDMYFCTASHVLINLNKTTSKDTVLNAKNISIHYISESEDIGSIDVNLDISLKEGMLKFDLKNDIVLVKLAELKITTTEGSKKYFNSVYLPCVFAVSKASPQIFNRNQALTFTEVKISSIIHVIGYPTALDIFPNSNQIDFDYPLVKRGIIAGKNRKLNTIILDCDVHYGNSGGPVFTTEGNELKIIGIITKKLFYETGQYKKNKNGYWDYVLNGSVGNSGYSVLAPYDSIEQLITEF